MTRKAKITAAVAASVLALAALVYLWAFDPTEAPAAQCVFHRLTGLDCPGCGTQRALHALLHGRLTEAWHYNAALFFALPAALLYAWHPRRLRAVLYATVTPFLLLAAVLAWWILRNLA